MTGGAWCRLLAMLALLWVGIGRAVAAPCRGTVELSVSVLVEGPGYDRPVQDGATVLSGERLVLSLRVKPDAYVYAITFSADGAAQVQYPEQGESLLKASRALLQPSGWGSLAFGEVPGVEEVLVLASLCPLPQEALERSQALQRLRPPPVKHDAVEARSKSLRAQGLTRDLTRVHKATRSEIRVRGAGQAWYPLTLRHERRAP